MIEIGKFYIILGRKMELFKSTEGTISFRNFNFHETVFVLGIEDYKRSSEIINVKLLTTDGFVGYITIPKSEWACYVESTDR